MDHYLAFLQQHWLLVVSFLLLLFIAMNMEEGGQQSTGYVLVDDAIQLINSGSAIFFDVRTLSEFNTKRIKHAIHYLMKDEMSIAKKYQKKKAILYCEDGKISAKARQNMKQNMKRNSTSRK